MAFARNKRRYIEGLTHFRNYDIAGWLEVFATATAEAALMATSYVNRVIALQETWREQLRTRPARPRADATAWALIDILPAHPIITVAIAVAATQRTKPAVNNAVAELTDAGILSPVSQLKRNRAWEAQGLLDLIGEMDAGTLRS